MRDAISGYFVVLGRNYLTSTLDYIVMQMETNREKGYYRGNSFALLPSRATRASRRPCFPLCSSKISK